MEYGQRVNALLLAGFIGAAVRLHDPDGRYTPAQVQRWLTGLADGLDWQARHNGSATDIALATWWRAVAHRAAVVHVALVTLIAVPWFAVAVLDHGILLAAVGAIMLVVAACGGVAPSPGRINTRQLLTRRGLQTFAFGLVAPMVFGLLIGLAGVLLVGLAFGLALGLAFGLVGGLALGLAIGLNDASPQAIRPREIVSEAGRYGLVSSGLVFGLVCGLAAGLVYGLVFGLAVGLALWLQGGLALFGNAWTRYHIAVAITAIHGSSPLRFGAWLNWAYRAGLLRVSGVAYQFRHRQLQDWLKSGVHAHAPVRPPPRTRPPKWIN